MKKIFLIASFLTATVTMVQAENSSTEFSTEVLNNSVVKSTYSLMQSKNNKECDELNEKSLNYMCTGLIPPTQTLRLLRSGCGIAVKINCPNEQAILLGRIGSVSAIDASGYRNDIGSVNLELSFSSITIESKQ
jgi:hypothetical protein